MASKRRLRNRTPETDAERQEKTLRTLISAYAKVFSGMEGEMVLDDLTAHFHDHETPCMDPRYRYADMLLVAEGQRSVIFYIRNLIQEAEKDARGDSTATAGRAEGFDVFDDHQ